MAIKIYSISSLIPLIPEISNPYSKLNDSEIILSRKRNFSFSGLKMCNLNSVIPVHKIHTKHKL
jgi:hypothetical protein